MDKHRHNTKYLVHANGLFNGCNVTQPVTADAARGLVGLATGAYKVPEGLKTVVAAALRLSVEDGG